LSDSELDVEFLTELLEGDLEFAKELFDTYSDSAEASLSEAEQLLKSGEHSKIFRPFHTLKGASASVGLLSVRAIAREFEKNAKEGRFAICEERLGELREAVDLGKKALSRYLESL
jgi:HPt (histidine-containing phosphotransfer) domain-containing protein